MLAIIICVVIIIVDQVSKYWAYHNLQGSNPIQVFGEWLQFEYVENRGAAFGMLQGQMWLFYIVTIFVVGLLLYFLFKYFKDSLYMNITLGLILGGAIGNFIDRLFRGFVVDFIKVDFIKSYNFPVFNLADVAITLGALLFLVFLILSGEDKE